jgi:cyclic pyranopterin phosphate synthase
MYDRFNRRINYLRVSVTDRCNLRCRYCMPTTGVELKQRDDILSFEEIHELVQSAVRMGIDKVRLTGGEPLVRRGILDLVRMLGQIPGIADLAMTTNGLLLPQYAQGLHQAGLQRLNISLDSIDPGRYRQITRGGELTAAMAGIEAALKVDFVKIKLNCVVRESPDEADARGVAEFAAGHGLEVRFIRQMNTRNGEFWRVFGGDGGHCEKCNRLRVASDGRIYPCLFSDDAYSVRELGARQALAMAVDRKPAAGRDSHHQFYAIGG